MKARETKAKTKVADWGLAIAANIAKIHSAKLGVKSEAGAGSEFWAEFELVNLKQA
ncbi:hypothetical protein [Campylobacter concisus]|uniref:hypothetical protein n=1 Tax=Campylobacter concisus TaxID=199 RepID=UPI0021560016|nr:hypothetical protein [Campylobacter concisus]